MHHTDSQVQQALLGERICLLGQIADALRLLPVEPPIHDAPPQHIAYRTIHDADAGQVKSPSTLPKQLPRPACVRRHRGTKLRQQGKYRSASLFLLWFCLFSMPFVASRLGRF
ncbi:hypothetical protein [Bradyrhizobium sp. sBnM-33]|uniref:hypothetical protein n=1 Tax=Bradyrhizobium sp. sBnM-33 TaxID=2831780 RepID=UPI001BCC7AE5|nr:hypothetical protein [Bradyrhizobium sp. sBnM-33]WOH48187.1 hypothetical protein RX328_29150 [Bradyrhizobium sp. sBnM-33]